MMCVLAPALAQNNNDTRQEILSILSEASDEVYDDPNGSLEKSIRAKELADQIKDDSLKAAALNRIGNAHWSLGNQMDAIEFLQKSLQLAEANNLEVLVSKNYGNIGNVYNAVGFNLDAINYYRLELGIQEQYQQSRRLFAVYNNIARAYFNLNQYDSAHHYLNKASKRLEDSFIHLSPILYSNQAETYLKQGKLEIADSLLEVTYRTSNQYGSKRTSLVANQLKAELERKKGNPEHALEHAQLASDMALEMGVKELIYTTSKTLANCYGDLGEFQKAFENQIRYEAYKDSVQNVKVRNELELLSYYQRLFRLRVLEEKNQISTTLAEQRQWIINGLVIVLVIATILIGIIFYSTMKIRKQKRELEQLNAFKTKIFAIVSHDLKSPIQSVSSVIEMFNEKLISKEEIEPYLPEVREKTSNLMGLLNNIFLWAEGQMEGENLAKENFTVHQVLEDLNAELKDRLEEKAIQLKYESAFGFNLHSNRGILRILLRNLIVNAIKFSHPKSIVEVNCVEGEETKIIEVIDQGIGMREEMREKLFTGGLESKVGTNGEQGNGLGLALCNDFVQILGGKIDVESVEGEGSVFRVILTDQDA
ncbi:Tetratricopeptide repeat-containing protein [Ekhidna lutea]|uniref:histidine kinase n=2 Tax=Ekhidna lutea TaxID=447679 RepID=A0A239FCK6_EKHLU|nr:Tetratricopeptide repeat-containing protein [Ekhidna lutea]